MHGRRKRGPEELQERRHDAAPNASRRELSHLECCSDHADAQPCVPAGLCSPEIALKAVDRLMALRLSLEPGLENEKVGASLTFQQLCRVQIVPGFNRGERLMISHVATQRCDGDEPLFNSVVVCAVSGAFVEILFPDPKVCFATRIDVFTDHGTSILD